jgi:hypothetical protein
MLICSPHITHSWSDIFFLGMDFPEGARVINCSIDLAVRKEGEDDDVNPIPPIETRLRLTTENPGTIRLTSVDLNASVVLTHVSQVFNYAADYLGLLKAGLVASGIVPLGLEKMCESEDMPIKDLLAIMFPGSSDGNECKYGLELTTYVHNIPKGSRLAVSTNLLGSIIAVGMRATQQTASLTGTLLESERRLVAARAILGEWLGGSGGGWQDSGGVWPGLKLIHGVKPQPEDPEYGISRGRLLPNHVILGEDDAPQSLLKALEESLVLVHGGMAQNVGPVLEMVSEKYLLREEEEWNARHRAMEILDEILISLKQSDVKRIAELVTENFFGPIRTVIPSATNSYTESVIEKVQARFGSSFWGFWMLGGMSGGGMGFIFDPSAKAEALVAMNEILLETKREMETALPFAMDPCVFEYKVNTKGTVAELCSGNEDTALPAVESKTKSPTQSLDDLLAEQGFDTTLQEQIRSDLQSGKIGLANNRLGSESELTDVSAKHVVLANDTSISKDVYSRGLEALEKGTVGVVTLSAGVGSRWTQGAGVVKAIHPFCCIGGNHRTFVDVHLAKNQKISEDVGMPIPHVFTTSWMTHNQIHAEIRNKHSAHDSPIYVSKGSSIGLRMVPVSCSEFPLYDLQYLLLSLTRTTLLLSRW